ncbi:LmbE family N-acetylglucosaminyl deacetylase [Actinoplanes octamycinicus]|uniref:LmbE family N-acetylglucosaminyl deacetylase n=1 Tax=Actinoplanes octamycinicus TaxID=135948 RepID=A0A7W7GWD8_9ACTN|nr:PIG-L family deacetylase [Actinoplanes octamycinicus]MBB4739556.1 LmbE family N-acetylglucosaminyl deacetylase [Actinoplanes octamycinicus]
MHWTRYALVTLILVAGLGAPSRAAAGPGRCALTVVAHEDDDLLFVNPEISDDIAAGRCVTTLYVTSGDAARGPDYWRSRERGEMAAYARMAGRPARWTEQTRLVRGHPVHRATLAGTRITLLFLRLPDRVGGWPDQTLQLLWLDPSVRMYTLDAGHRYTRATLLTVLTAVMVIYQPTVIRTLDFRGAYGDGDHDDHHTVAYLTHAAQLRYRTPHRITGHLGYPVARRPANLTAARYRAKLGHFLAYAPHDRVVCQTADRCDRGGYGAYLRRDVRVPAPAGPGRNVAGQALPAASSGNEATVEVAAKAVDGRRDGALLGEWVTVGERAGAWLTLTWPDPQVLNRIVLYDRPNRADRITGAVLRFSDGSTVPVGPLPDDGSPLTVHFAPKAVTSLRFTVTGVSGTTRDAGLAEIRAVTAA